VIAGIDVNLRRVTVCGIPVGKFPVPTRPLFEVMALTGKPDAIASARRIGEQAREFPWHWYDAIAFARPSGRAIKQVADLSRVYGAVLAAIPCAIPVTEYVPAEWKRLAGLKGNADKLAVMAWADREAQGVVVWDEHMADAYAVARAYLSECERAAA
jgi:hypothetical protein